MLRALTYVAIAWLCMAAIPAFGAVFGLTLVLPSSTAIILVHLAFSHDDELPFGLAVAVALGYLEDVHQGAYPGVLSLAHGVAYLALYWAAGRLALPSVVARMTACAAFILVVDVVTWLELFVLADSLSLRREGLWTAWAQVPWHVLATALLCPPLWSALDRVLLAFGMVPPTDDGGLPAIAPGGEER